MQCTELQILFPDWIRERENNPQHFEIEQHLRSCENCKREVEQFKQLFSAIESDEHYVPSQQYFVNLLPRIHERVEAKKKKKFYWRIVEFGLPFAMAIILFIFFNPFSKPTQTNLDFGIDKVFQNVDANELQEYASTIIDDESEENLSSRETMFSDDDKEVLQTLIAENTLSTSSFTQLVDDDETISLSGISDNDAEKIVSQLEKKFHK